jgi:hypothetical protein
MKILSVFALIAVCTLVTPAYAETGRAQVISVNEADGSVRVVTADGRESVMKITSQTRMSGASRISDLRAGDSLSFEGDSNFVTGAMVATSVDRIGVSAATGRFGANANAPLVSLESASPTLQSSVDNTVGQDRQVSDNLSRNETALSDQGVVQTSVNSSPVDNTVANGRFTSPGLVREEAARTSISTSGSTEIGTFTPPSEMATGAVSTSPEGTQGTVGLSSGLGSEVSAFAPAQSNNQQ